MSFEYMFFDDASRDRFVAFAQAHGVESSVRPDTLAGYVVALPDTLDDDQQDAFEAEYDAIMDGETLAAESNAELVSHGAVALTATLADGTMRDVRVPPPIARRLLAHFSIDEIHEIVSAIAQGLEQPDAPICHRLEP